MTTLEDFFTLTEMKDGLSDIVRVEELLQLVQDVNDGSVNNLGDAIRQWSTVASILVATQNNECLDHFVQLDGLCFLNKWLQEAIDCNADGSQNNVKELIDKLLVSLERLPIHNEKLTASGIARNIQRLLDHKNVKIMKKASLLCDKWNLVTESVATCHKLQQGGASQGDLSGCPIEEKETEVGLPEANPIEVSSTKEKDGKVQSSENENVTTKRHHLESSNHSSSVKEHVQVYDQTLPSASLNSDSAATQVLGDTDSSAATPVPNSVQNLSYVIEENSVCAEVGFASATTSVIQGERGDGDVVSQCHTVSHDVSNSVKEMNMDLVADKPLYHFVPNGAVDNSVSSVSEKLLEGTVQPAAPCNLDSNVTESSSAKLGEPQTESEAIDTAARPATECCAIMESKPLIKANKSSQEHCILTNTYSTSKPPQFSCQRDVSDQFHNLLEDRNWEMDFELMKGNTITGDSSLKSNGDNAAKEIDHKLGFTCIDDALEVARQVAIQVEREVVDYREGFCSSPEVNFGEDAGANNSDSEEAVKQDHELTEEAGEHSSLPEKDNSLDSSSSKDGSEVTHNVGSDLENLDQDLQSQKLDAPAQESVGNSETDRCGLDLNVDIVNEEYVCINPVNVSAPVAIVAPSRGSPILPVTLQFEGGMGWKGTAATSAFRPASPRRTSESDKTISISKQKRAFLDIDLNVAESEDEVIGQLSVKQMPSSLPSDSLTEVSSQRAGKLKLDLNRLGDEDASTYPTAHFKIHQKGEQSLSSASSSSSKHPSIRDFDLNNNPSFLDVGASHNFDKSTKASDIYGASNLNDPAITILGSRMAVERRDFGNQVQQLFPTNGFNIEHSAVAGQSNPYAHMHPPVYGFAGIPTVPSLPAQAFYSPGSFPYIDARGQPVIMHQATGMSGYNGQAPNRPPFFMNVPAATSNPVAAYGSARPGFDINAGMTLFDTGVKGANFKHFLFQGQNNLLEDQAKALPQSSSSVLPSKRKEPDSGWESYPYGYRQMT